MSKRTKHVSDHANKIVVQEARDARLDGEPLTVWQHRENMRREAEESRLEILRLREQSAEYNRLVRKA